MFEVQYKIKPFPQAADRCHENSLDRYVYNFLSFLRERGFGGLYGVGKAAEHPPALAVLSHIPTAAKVSKHIPGRWIRIRMDLH